MTITANSMSVGTIAYTESLNNRTLSNNTGTASNSTLTLNGVGVNPLVSVSGSGTFTIQGSAVTAGSFEATHAVDVTETFAVGVTSLRAHKTYLEGLGDAFGDPEEFLESFARATGTRLGCTYAVSFEVYPLQFT